MIRPLTAADVAHVVALGRDVLPGAWADAALADEVTREGALPWGVFEGEVLAGFALLRVVIDEAELMLLGVAPSLRRRGHASALWRAVEGALAERGVLRVLLEVRASNDPAIALYEAQGFAEIARRRGYYKDTGEDALVMERKIG